jgi:hypothetical protein
MKFIKQIVVGSSECPMTPENVSQQIIDAHRRAKEDNKYFDWKIEYFSVTLVDGELWLVGYED